jgi:copper homeostasis protein
MSEIIFEVCAETLEACVAAQEGGASRVELCAALSEGGLTPSHGLIRSAVARCGLPVHAMVRPRGGDYVYTAGELEIMHDDIAHMKTLGVAGVVLGLLRPDSTVDVEATRALVAAAKPLDVTFHRAFDDAADLAVALEDVIVTGCDRVLTSGGESDVHTGASVLAQLVEQAAGRVEIAAGGGLRLEDAAALARQTGGRHFHGSLREWVSPEPAYLVRAEAVREMVETLRRC